MEEARVQEAPEMALSTREVLHDLITERGLVDWRLHRVGDRDVLVGSAVSERLQDNRLQRKRKHRGGGASIGSGGEGDAGSAPATLRSLCCFVVVSTTLEPALSMEILLDLHATARSVSPADEHASSEIERVYLCLTDAGNISVDLELLVMVLTLARLSRASPSRPWAQRALSVLSGVSEDLLISTSIGHQIGGDSHAALVDSLVKTNVVPANSRLERALRAVDRGAFAPLEARSTPASYENRPLKIGVVATISTPQQHAQVMGLLEEHLQPGADALDIGCGSGYLVAVMAHLVGATGSVTGVDIVPELVDFSKQNLEAALDEELLPATSIVKSGSKQVLGDVPAGVQYDAIHVGVAVETKAEAEKFLEFLKPGGGLLVPLGRGGEEQKLVKMTKRADGEVTKVDVMSVLCQPILDDVPVLEVKETRSQKAERLEKELKQWRESFEAQHKRRPTRDDMMNDATAKQLFTEFAGLRK